MLKQLIKNNLGTALKIFALSIMLFANLNMAWAADNSQTFDRNQYATFPVKSILTVDSKTPGASATGTQDQTYLTSGNPVAAFILQIINLISLTAASLSFLAVVIAGFLMMSSAGNDNQLNKGKDILTRALVGLAITLSAYFIVSFVQNLFFETVPK